MFRIWHKNDENYSQIRFFLLNRKIAMMIVGMKIFMKGEKHTFCHRKILHTHFSQLRRITTFGVHFYARTHSHIPGRFFTARYPWMAHPETDFGLEASLWAVHLRGSNSTFLSEGPGTHTHTHTHALAHSHKRTFLTGLSDAIITYCRHFAFANAAVFVAVMRIYPNTLVCQRSCPSPYSHCRISATGTYANGKWWMANGKW